MTTELTDGARIWKFRTHHVRIDMGHIATGIDVFLVVECINAETFWMALHFLAHLQATRKEHLLSERRQRKTTFSTK